MFEPSYRVQSELPLLLLFKNLFYKLFDDGYIYFFDIDKLFDSRQEDLHKMK